MGSKRVPTSHMFLWTYWADGHRVLGAGALKVPITAERQAGGDRLGGGIPMYAGSFLHHRPGHLCRWRSNYQRLISQHHHCISYSGEQLSRVWESETKISEQTNKLVMPTSVIMYNKYMSVCSVDFYKVSVFDIFLMVAGFTLQMDGALLFCQYWKIHSGILVSN